MARYTGPRCKLCRREGEKLFLKGERCYTNKCGLERRAYPPGQHGQGRRKASEYGRQLRTKQYAKRYYGLLENQFHHYFEIAVKMPGVPGENLLQLLEARLDNVIYRLGFASSRSQARQFVIHGHFTVDGKKVDIPSYRVKEGQVVTLKDKARKNEFLKSFIEANSARPTPNWLSLNRETLEATIVELPSRDQIDIPIEETLIVELYSK